MQTGNEQRWIIHRLYGLWNTLGSGEVMVEGKEEEIPLAYIRRFGCTACPIGPCAYEQNIHRKGVYLMKPFRCPMKELEDGAPDWHLYSSPYL